MDIDLIPTPELIAAISVRDGVKTVADDALQVQIICVNLLTVGGALTALAPRNPTLEHDGDYLQAPRLVPHFVVSPVSL